MSSASKNKEKNSFSKEKKYLTILNEEDTDELSDFIQDHLFKDLYDYIFRMIGNCDLTFSIVSKTSREIVKHFKKLNLNSYSLFKVFLYKTARSLCEDSLNTDTSKLENNGYETLKKDLGSKKMSEMIFLEKNLQSIKPQLKEVLLLKYRSKFNSEEICQILSVTKEKEAILEAQAIDLIIKVTDMKEDSIKDDVSKFPLYTHEESQIEETKALSQIIGGLKDKNSIVPHILYVMFKALIFVAIALGCFYLGRKYK